MRSKRRVVDARRQREGDVQRADGTRDEAADLVGRLSRQLRPGHVHLVRVILEPVVRLADRRRGEGVRRRDVGAGGEVVAVNAEDDLGARQVEQVRIARDVARVVLEPLAAVGLLTLELALDEHAPRAVEHGDALAEDGFESCARVLQFGSLLLPKENRTLRKARGSLGVC